MSTSRHLPPGWKIDDALACRFSSALGGGSAVYERRIFEAVAGGFGGRSEIRLR